MGIFRSFFVVCLLILPVWAHQLWMEEEKGCLVLNYGHIHPSGHETEKIQYTPDSIKKAICYKNGSFSDIKVEKTPLIVKNNCSVVFVQFSTGYWTKTVEGTVHLPKHRAVNPVYSWLSIENLVFIKKWEQAAFDTRFEGLVILPLKDPLKLKEGDKVRLVVLLNGRPVSDVPVAYDGKIRGATDENGRINIRIKHPGLQMIEASIRQKLNSNRADYVVYSSTLNFEVK
ncbi:DUF4198 domain-containing protein [Persephonella sp.]